MDIQAKAETGKGGKGRVSFWFSCFYLPDCWDYRCVPLHLVLTQWGVNPGFHACTRPTEYTPALRYMNYSSQPERKQKLNTQHKGRH